jgi:hypothetical protein
MSETKRRYYGGGRKPLPPEEKTKNFQLRLKPSLHVWAKANHEKIRQMIELMAQKK